MTPEIVRIRDNGDGTVTFNVGGKTFGPVLYSETCAALSALNPKEYERHNHTLLPWDRAPQEVS